MLLTGFGSVNVSAAENLVNPNLAQWDNVNNGNITDSELSEVTVTSYIDFYRLNADYVGVVGDSNPTHFWVGHMFDTSSLKAGRKYNFSIHIPSVSELKSNSYLSGLADSYFTDAYNGGVLAVTFGTLKSDGSINSILELLTIDSTNYMDLMGTDYVYNFTCPDYSGGSPAIFIHLYHTSASLKSNPMFFLGNDMTLVDEDAAEEDNFLSRIFEWFQEKFDAIGDAFSNLGNKLSTGFTNLGDRIKTFFSDLGTSISNGLNSVKEGIQNKLEQVKTTLVELGESLIQGIQNLFVPDEDYILEWKDNLDTLLKEHLGMIYTSADLVTDLIEKVFDIVFNAPDEYGLSIPEVSFENTDGTTVTVFPETEISFDFMENKTFKTIYGLYGVALYIFFGVLEAKYGIRVYKKVMAN